MKEDKFYRNFTIVLLTIAAVYIMYRAWNLATPVLTGLLVAYLLYPFMRIGRSFGIPKGISILCILVAFAGGTTLLVDSMVPAIKKEVSAFTSPEEATEATEKVQSRLMEISVDLVNKVKKLGLIGREGRWDDAAIEDKITATIRRFIKGEIVSGLLDFSKKVPKFAANVGQFLMIFLFVLIFALLDGDKFQKWLIQMIPNSYFEPGVFILKKTLDLWGYYLRGLVIENLIMGVVSFILLVIVSMVSSLTITLALSIALIIAVTNVIRIIGPIIGALIGVFLVLTQSTDLAAIFGILGVVLIVQALDNMLIMPLVMKERMNIHPVVCLLGIFMGGIIANVIGMILAIPVIAGVKVVYRILTVEMKKFNMDPDPLAGVPVP